LSQVDFTTKESGTYTLDFGSDPVTGNSQVHIRLAMSEWSACDPYHCEEYNSLNASMRLSTHPMYGSGWSEGPPTECP
jgi:hypothetical protein